nr:hypothetical protein BaRGS_000677 [Batillaria attramentaria]
MAPIQEVKVRVRVKVKVRVKMRACSMFLLLLVSAMLVTERQADGFLFDGNKVEDTVRKAGKWVMDNCNLNKDGVTCNGVKLLRRRRSTQGLTDQSLTATLDKVCPEFNVGPKAKMADVVDTAMQEMDANKDGTLNTNESWCSCRKKRESGVQVDSVAKALKEVCPKGLTPDMDVSNLVQDAFNQADENQDGALNVDEVGEFAGLIDLLEFCTKQKFEAPTDVAI